MSEILFSVELSLFVAALSTCIVALIGSALGYLLARGNFPLKSFLDAACTLPLVLPPTVIGYYLLEIFGKQGFLGRPLFALFGYSLVFSWQAAVIAAVTISLPLMVKTSKAAFESVDRDLELVALSLGKSHLETVWRISLPLAAPGLFAGIALSFTRGLGEFGATLMLAGNIPGKTQTVPLLIFEAVQSGESQLVGTLVLVLSIFSFLVLLAINKWGKKYW